MGIKIRVPLVLIFFILGLEVGGRFLVKVKSVLGSFPTALQRQLGHTAFYFAPSGLIAVFNWMYQYFASVSVGSVGGIFIEIVSLLI